VPCLSGTQELVNADEVLVSRLYVLGPCDTDYNIFSFVIYFTMSSLHFPPFLTQPALQGGGCGWCPLCMVNVDLLLLLLPALKHDHHRILSTL
jgi:hypothetical protein